MENLRKENEAFRIENLRLKKRNKELVWENLKLKNKEKVLLRKTRKLQKKNMEEVRPKINETPLEIVPSQEEVPYNDVSKNDTLRPSFSLNISQSPPMDNRTEDKYFLLYLFIFL